MSTNTPVLILASASPRRAQLLQQIQVPHRVIVADIDERQLPHESIEQCVQRLARSKALQVHSQLAASGAPEAQLPVLGADTVVVIDQLLLGKPRDRADALEMLQRLSGRTHHVLSAVALSDHQGVRQRLSKTEVRLCALNAAQCEAYWDSGEPQGKAGAYAIQCMGAVFIESIHGSYSGVMGLPLFETAQLLNDAGIVK